MIAPVRNTVLHGDCITLMQRLPEKSVDFILTDPPYLVRYRDRSGRTVANDDNPDWLKPAFSEMYRLLKNDRLVVCFYGWNHVGQFMDAWREAGFRVVGHLVFCKRYAASRKFLGHHHEQAYLLAKGRPPIPARHISDVRDWDYTGNRLHPTQKPVRPLLDFKDETDGNRLVNGLPLTVGDHRLEFRTWLNSNNFINYRLGGNLKWHAMVKGPSDIAPREFRLNELFAVIPHRVNIAARACKS